MTQIGLFSRHCLKRVSALLAELYDQLLKWIKPNENGAAFLSFIHSSTIAPITWKTALTGKHTQEKEAHKTVAGFSLDNTACCYGFLVPYSGIYYCFASLESFQCTKKCCSSQVQHVQKYRHRWQGCFYHNNLGVTVKKSKLNKDVNVLNFCKKQRIVPACITSHNPLD